MKKKGVLFLMALLLCTAGLFAAAEQEAAVAGEKEVKITLATGDAIGSLRNLMGERLKEEIEARTELNISINHVEGPVLGSANQIMDQVIEGGVQIFGNDLAWFVPYDPDLQPTSFGFVFRDEEHYMAYLASDMFSEIVDRIALDSGLRLVSATPMATRMFFSVEPLNTAKDLEGLKMRAPGLEMFIESYKAYGMSPTTVAWNEIFLALKTGVAEAAQGPVADVIANNWQLAAPNITRMGDMFAANGWFVNDKFWQALSENQKNGMIEVFADVNDWAFNQAIDNEAELIAGMVAEGAIYNNSFAEKDIVRAKALAAAKKLEAAGKWSAGLIDSIDAVK
jgi:TRAP-type transport system periplasmic protein